MPELPEVETIARALATRLIGRSISSVEQRRADLRWPLPDRFVERVGGRLIEGVTRRAKYILVRLDGADTLILHLGMSGRLVFDGFPRGPHEHLTFHFNDGTSLRYVDPRRFGTVDLWPTGDLAQHRLLRNLGTEPLESSFNGRALLLALEGSRICLKTAIMDQRRIAGVGNIYANEALFRARLSPFRSASSIGPERGARLAAAIRAVLREAIAKGGTSLRDYVQTNGELGGFQKDFRVYGQADEPCSRCSRPIRRLVQSGRATYFCSFCQR